MSNEQFFDDSETRTRKGLTSYFRRIARALRRGDRVPADEEQTVTVDPAAESEVEVEVERDGEEVTLGIDVS